MGCRKIFNSFILCASTLLSVVLESQEDTAFVYTLRQNASRQNFQCRLECSSPNARLAWCITTNLAGLHKVKLSLVILESTKKNTTLFVEGYSDMSVLNVTTHLERSDTIRKCRCFGL